METRKENGDSFTFIIDGECIDSFTAGCVIDTEYGCLYLPSETFKIDDKIEIRLSLRPQKPAEWSEEDERIRLACIATINDVIDYERERWEDYNPGKPYRPITKYDEQIDWLKSLKK